MTKMYFAEDGNCGDAEGLVVLDLSTLGFPIVDEFWHLLGDDERAPMVKALQEHASTIRLMRNLLDPDTTDAETEFPEYLRAFVDLLHDLLGTDLLGTEHEPTKMLLTAHTDAA